SRKTGCRQRAVSSAHLAPIAREPVTAVRARHDVAAHAREGAALCAARAPRELGSARYAARQPAREALAQAELVGSYAGALGALGEQGGGRELSLAERAGAHRDDLAVGLAQVITPARSRVTRDASAPRLEHGL